MHYAKLNNISYRFFSFKQNEFSFFRLSDDIFGYTNISAVLRIDFFFNVDPDRLVLLEN